MLPKLVLAIAVHKSSMSGFVASRSTACAQRVAAKILMAGELQVESRQRSQCLGPTTEPLDQPQAFLSIEVKS